MVLLPSQQSWLLKQYFLWITVSHDTSVSFKSICFFNIEATCLMIEVCVVFARDVQHAVLRE